MGILNGFPSRTQVGVDVLKVSVAEIEYKKFLSDSV
jgi:hypothetical protein